MNLLMMEPSSAWCDWLRRSGFRFQTHEFVIFTISGKIIGRTQPPIPGLKGAQCVPCKVVPGILSQQGKLLYFEPIRKCDLA